MKCFKALLALAVLGAASAAVAQNSDGRPYIYAGGIMVLPDDRTEESDESFGGMFGYGIPLINTDLPYLGNKLDLDFSVSYHSLKTETTEHSDFPKTLMTDVINRFSRENMIAHFVVPPSLLARTGD